MHRHYLFSSESVARGHPDKVADQIADAILDELLSKDPAARVACEVLVTTGLALVSGEIHTEKAYAEIPQIVRRTIHAVGYNDPTFGFDSATCGVLVSIDEQSPDISRGVEADERIGAGDQGIMFGYATDETPELMPLPIALAHRMMIRLEEARVGRILPWLRPDGKGQVAVRYENDRPTWIEAVVLSAQHEDVGIEKVREGLREEVIAKVLPPGMFDPARLVLHVNPTGRFVEGGPRADTGLSGRKIIVDTYGGMAPHGGGSFSGKDPTKVDRSGTYAARWVAKNVVAAGLAERCLIQIAYAIGVAEPVSIAVETHGTEKLPLAEIERRIRRVFDLTPRGIIEALDLRRPIYERTACYGHFGRELPEFTWERTDRADALRERG
ncbi:MAG: methionine adenosyltransferase [Candidatus Eisenbacteria bacterium]|uniref:S-adenosylmethionine synthase n=1 Tax=Eiseniibacteriota bacterium TaxID=2212470 RepID=A0A938BQZ8_UNCEI|nr:methionine adenosyltransferase [Candidatus Eisenbacteria bacterium]